MKHTLPREISRAEIEELIDSWIVGRYGERNRKIMRLRLIDGLTFEQISERVDMSTRGVVKIIYRCLDVLSRHI